MNRRISRHKAIVRTAAALLALLQFGASTAVVAADALLDGHQMAEPIHVESQHPEDCPAHHDHIFCQVVRTLGAATPGHGVEDVENQCPVYTRVASAHVSQAPRGPIVFGAAGPRAPPLG